MSTKMKLLTIYVVLGLVWCILGLPNLLAKSGNSTIKAIGLALVRITAWPVLATMAGHKFIQENKEDEDEDTATSTD
jgi:hypothetical protein